MGRAEEDPLQRADRPDLDPGPARQGRRRRGHPPVRAPAGRLGGASERRPEHQDIGAGRDRLGELAAAAHPAVGDHRDIAPGLGEIGVTRRGDIADRGDLRNADPEDLAGRAGGARPDPDEDGRGPLLHQRERRLGVGRVADGDGDRHEPGEVVERQRVVAGRQVAGADETCSGRGTGRRRARRRTGRTDGPAPGSRRRRPSSPAAWISSIRRAISSSRIGWA